MSVELQSASLYNDSANFARLRLAAQGDHAAAVPAVAREFEALFLQMMLKSMRAATPGDGLFDSQESDFYREMHDAQLAAALARSGGIGLAEQLAAQLDPAAAARRVTPRQGLAVPLRHPGLIAPAAAPPPAVPAAPASGETRFDSPADFVRALWPQAQRHARDLGVDPRVLIAQAALETGWGRHVIRDPRSGASSHNLFNIKADHRWAGASVGVNTLEYRDGVAQQERASFRAYDSYEHSFADYVAFVRSSPRYAQALARAGQPEAYAHALQDGGYATDPRYAHKIVTLMNGPVLRDALQAASAPRAQEARTAAATAHNGGNGV